MGGTVYLKTDRFEVKLEGITFKTRDFEALCKMGFLFADGKTWDRRPVVGVDVMYHPRDPSTLLLLLCFGLGCVILRFGAGESLPAGIHKFLADKRIHVVGFGIPEKIDLFPFEELGLTKNNSDIGYLAAKSLKNPKYKTSKLDGLARKFLGIKKMIGLTEASTSERHEQIKSAICQLFITTLVAMKLPGANEKKNSYSFFKNLVSLHLLAWKKKVARFVQDKMVDDNMFEEDKVTDKTMDEEDKVTVDENMFEEDNALDKVTESIVEVVVDEGECLDLESPEDNDKIESNTPIEENENDKTGSNTSNDECEKKKAIKGILKCPSTTLYRSKSLSVPSDAKDMLKRANSKGCNVRFQFH